jgi:ribonuclease HI
VTSTETAATIIAGATRCSLNDARGAVATLIAHGWIPPVGNSQLENTVDAFQTVSVGSTLVVHTDGACSGNPGPGGWAAVFSFQGEIVTELSGGEKHTTNNQMELKAILEAIRKAPSGVALEIATDSKLAIGWLTGSMKRKNPGIIALSGEIDEARRQRTLALNGQTQTSTVTFRHVRGHGGDPLNQRADSLATAAIKRA